MRIIYLARLRKTVKYLDGQFKRDNWIFPTYEQKKSKNILKRYDKIELNLTCLATFPGLEDTKPKSPESV
jgi:hypothetical protein